MFGKFKKQKSKSPVEEMEQFYLNQFLNSPQTSPQVYNGMPQNGPMMGPNNSAGPQFQNRNGMNIPIGGPNPMMNNNFNQNQLPMTPNNFNPNQFPMVNNQNQIPMMNNFNSNQSPIMSNPLNQNPYAMTGNNPQQFPQIANQMNTNPYNGFNPNPSPLVNNNPNLNQLPMNNNNFNPSQMPSLINETLTSNIGAEPSSSTSFPGQFSFNDFSFSQPTQQSLPDLTPSLDDLTGTNLLSNQYFRPNSVLTGESGAGAQAQKEIQNTNPTTSTNNPTLIPTNSVGSTNPNIPTTQNNPVSSYPNNQLTYYENPPQNYSMTNNQNIDLYDIKNKVDNINIRLRKVESYLGFRPETTI